MPVAIMRVMCRGRISRSIPGVGAPVPDRQPIVVALGTALVVSLLVSALLTGCGTPQLVVPRNGCSIAFPIASQQPNVDAILSGAWAAEVCSQVGDIAGTGGGPTVLPAPMVATTLPPGARVICSVQKPTFLSNEGRVGYGAPEEGQTIRYTKFLRVQIVDTRATRDDLEACGALHDGTLPF